MKRYLMFLLPLLLAGCETDQTPQQQAARETADAHREAMYLLKRTSIECADGNQVRFVIYALGGNGSSFTAWPVLNDDGTPKKCVKRAKAVQPEYEEVPQ